MEIPGLGNVEKDPEFDWYRSDPIAVPVLGGMECEFILEDYDDDPAQNEFHDAIKNFLAIDQSVLFAAEEPIYKYYRNCYAMPLIPRSRIWKKIRLGSEPMVTRRAYGDKGIYISLSCGCDWEQEHGLQIVFKNGLVVNKVGPYDGHVTNSDAYADDRLEDVVYKG